MTLPPILLQFLVSLLAILALYALVRGLKLGQKPRLENEDAVRVAANEVEDGFACERIAISRNGAAALAHDSHGKIMVIKRHGNQFAGRILTPQTQVQEVVDAIIVDCGEARFGKVRLSLENPASWVDAINRL